MQEENNRTTRAYSNISSTSRVSDNINKKISELRTDLNVLAHNLVSIREDMKDKIVGIDTSSSRFEDTVSKVVDEVVKKLEESDTDKYAIAIKELIALDSKDNRKKLLDDIERKISSKNNNNSYQALINIGFFLFLLCLIIYLWRFN